jgi:hypothetical protein
MVIKVPLPLFEKSTAVDRESNYTVKTASGALHPRFYINRIFLPGTICIQKTSIRGERLAHTSEIEVLALRPARTVREFNASGPEADVDPPAKLPPDT